MSDNNSPPLLKATSGRSPFLPFWRKKASSPVLSSPKSPPPSPGPEGFGNRFLKPIEVLPPPEAWQHATGPKTWDGFFSPSLTGSSPLSSPATSLPDLTRSSTRETLYIKALPPTPTSTPPRPLRSLKLLTRKATPYRSRLQRPKSTDTLPPLSLALKVEAGQVSPKPTQERWRRRSSMPNLKDLAKATTVQPFDGAFLAPPLVLGGRALTPLSHQSLPVTPSDAEHGNAFEQLIIAPQSKPLDLSGLGIVSETIVTDNAPVEDPPTTARSSNSSLLIQYAEYPTAFDPTSDPATADERSRTLEALEGRSPGLRPTSEDRADLLRLQQSPPFDGSDSSPYFFGRSRFTATTIDSQTTVPSLIDQGVQTETAPTSCDKAIQVVDVHAVDRLNMAKTVVLLQCEVERLRAHIAALEQALRER